MRMAFDPEPAHNWRLRCHLQTPTGRIGDPNGLSQLDGTYHVFHQYTPYWPARTIGWGHWTTPDFRSWEFHGEDIAPELAQEVNGVYSGSAIVDGGDLWCYYTGNVKHPGDHDYVHDGREANEILLVAPGGADFSGKRKVLLANADYPAWCSCHVRDPKVWRQDGRLWMLLGARTLEDRGCVLLYGSDDGVAWQAEGSLTVRGPRFGYMWECPNIARVDGHEFLLLCPQGVPKRPFAMQCLHNAGYFPIEGRLIDLMRAGGDPMQAAGPQEALDAGSFRELDFGFDFYAQQAFEDERGRTILFGWVGQPDPEKQYDVPTREWIHTLTWPRELSVNEAGRLCQLPVEECDALRLEEVPLTAEGARGTSGHVGGTTCDEFDLTGAVGAAFAGCAADVELLGIQGAGRLLLDADLELLVTPDMLELAFTSPAGRYRTVRRLPAAQLSSGRVESLRVVVDTSLVEAYVNGGEFSLTTRWFPDDVSELRVSSTIPSSSARGWTLAPYELSGV
ncbi:MAG: glycoside hydrolase family 32 protein [Atopobiaceae bacterium]|jgi:beta-fructofuranosidase|nr:glycoside hydrolase family 32 protein [Atopobiaceae bacterium]MCH4119462.1 glycoside hydrolase family 32 protein [Atopobiaceae bacterium]MCI1318247.1 glycoside hydrolase family 32 protein [Atopobiaceae bacterium]MCI1389049.1 glycoside hydrolase family 32 protein [Atopobiaceae bacterium]MCI1431717.1 glycoside hydrolase family 32 protein [Atopobiaceae bacterium]